MTLRDGLVTATLPMERLAYFGPGPGAEQPDRVDVTTARRLPSPSRSETTEAEACRREEKRQKRAPESGPVAFASPRACISLLADRQVREKVEASRRCQLSLWGNCLGGAGRGYERPHPTTGPPDRSYVGPPGGSRSPGRSAPQIPQLPAFRSSVGIRMWLPRMLARLPGRATPRHEIFASSSVLPRTISGWLQTGSWTREKSLAVGCLALPCQAQRAACSFALCRAIGLQICLCPASTLGWAGWQLEESSGGHARCSPNHAAYGRCRGLLLLGRIGSASHLQTIHADVMSLDGERVSQDRSASPEKGVTTNHTLLFFGLHSLDIRSF